MALLDFRLSLAVLCDRINDFDEALFHALEALEMLKNRTIDWDDVEFNHIYWTECALSNIYLHKLDYPNAQYHSEQRLSIARRKYNGEERTTVIYQCLSNLSTVMSAQSFHKKALTLSEEAYEMVSGEYGPEHPDVQDAANLFISSLMSIGDFSRTEDFARTNYETLISGANPESKASAVAMKQLVFLWIQKPIDPDEDPEIGEEAERLAKKAFDIIVKIYGPFSDPNNLFSRAINDVSRKKELLTVARNEKRSST
jgi:tetratricopeptide (TPR) repeat protein